MSEAKKYATTTAAKAFVIAAIDGVNPDLIAKALADDLIEAGIPEEKVPLAASELATAFGIPITLMRIGIGCGKFADAAEAFDTLTGGRDCHWVDDTKGEITYRDHTCDVSMTMPERVARDVAEAMGKFAKQ